MARAPYTCEVCNHNFDCEKAIDTHLKLPVKTGSVHEKKLIEKKLPLDGPQEKYKVFDPTGRPLQKNRDYHPVDVKPARTKGSRKGVYSQGSYAQTPGKLWLRFIKMW